MDKDIKVLKKEILDKMVIIYCKGNKHSITPCAACKEIMNYAHIRIDNCVFSNGIKFCSKCNVHCFKPEMRTNVKSIMRYSGPRIVFYYPVMAIKHLMSLLI